MRPSVSGNGPPAVQDGRAKTPRAMTRSTAAWPIGRSQPSEIRSNSRPPMKRSDGAGSPSTVTLEIMSRSPSSAESGQSRLMMMTQVPVETMVNPVSPVMR